MEEEKEERLERKRKEERCRGEKMEDGGKKKKKRTGRGSWERKQQRSSFAKEGKIASSEWDVCVYIYIREPCKHRPMTAQ